MQVALLAEGVDRNPVLDQFAIHSVLSPSSRRAWIEMQEIQTIKRKCEVALLAEGVDRNTVRNVEGVELGAGRPPRGGRG